MLAEQRAWSTVNWRKELFFRMHTCANFGLKECSCHLCSCDRPRSVRSLGFLTVLLLLAILVIAYVVLAGSGSDGTRLTNMLPTDLSASAARTVIVVPDRQSVTAAVIERHFKSKTSFHSANVHLSVPVASYTLELSTLNARQLRVRTAFSHAWNGYERGAWSHDELRPVTNATNDSWGGWGATLVDGLDTAILMGFTEEVARARQHIVNLSFDRDRDISFFETIIRYVGGLLGAYELSRDTLYLNTAQKLADLLLGSFSSTVTGIPRSVANPGTQWRGCDRRMCDSQKWHNHKWTQDASVLAEIGSCQLEFAYLSYHTGNDTYRKVARNVLVTLANIFPGKFDTRDPLDHSITLMSASPEILPVSFPPNALSPFSVLWPVYIDPHYRPSRLASTHYTIGALADSFYEYLLKLWLLNRDPLPLQMFERASETILEHLVFTVHRASLLGSKTVLAVRTPPSPVILKSESTGGKISAQDKFVFIGQYNNGAPLFEMEHLMCFAGGLFALGASETLRVFHQTKTRDASNDGVLASGSRTAPDPLWHATLRKLVDVQPSHMKLARDITDTCIELYREQPTGLGPESVRFDPDHGGWKVLQGKYMLRPETVESLFVLFRVTGDVRYQEVGWTMFQSLERHCRTPLAFSGITDVRHSQPTHDNSMQSFFFAETLKYFFLLFSPPSLLPLSEYVFTTEGHPLHSIPS